MQDKAYQDVYNEILAALGELYPERQDKHRDMARGLAEEYLRERGQAMQDLRPKHPEAPPTEQMIFDEEYAAMQSADRMQGRMEGRLKAEQRREKSDARKYALPKPGQAMPRMPSVSYTPADSQSAGSPEARYGFRIGSQYTTMNWQDHDGDGIDDGWQRGPGQPSVRGQGNRPSVAQPSNQPAIPRGQPGSVPAAKWDEYRKRQRGQ